MQRDAATPETAQQDAAGHDAFDVVIVGGGAARLAAAVALGRARRRVVVVDAGQPRNAPAAHMHGFLSRDGISPADFLSIGRDEARKYGTQFSEDAAVTAARNDEGSFVVELAAGRTVTGRGFAADERPAGWSKCLPQIPGRGFAADERPAGWSKCLPQTGGPRSRWAAIEVGRDRGGLRSRWAAIEVVSRPGGAV